VTVENPPLRAGRREWIGLAVLALPTLLVSLDLFVMLLAVPHLSADLGASSTQQLWILDIYGFMVAGFLLTMGTLGDRIGRRRLLLIGAATFGAASLLAAWSTSPELLIAARALLGIAGATLTPSTLSLITNLVAEAAPQRLAQLRQLGAQPTTGQLGQHLGVAFAGDQRAQHRPARDAQDVSGHRDPA
jgi:MFS transporter, DHA2 family, multidrug resistance protein